MSLAKFVGSIALSAGLFFSTAALATAGTLGVPLIAQEKSQWCWAAASKMVIRYKTSNDPSQCSVVKKGFNTSDCANSPGSIYGDVERALNAYGVKPGTAYASIPTEAKVREYIDAGKPILVRYGYKSSLFLVDGHMVV
jgi:hypothetical protein